MLKYINTKNRWKDHILPEIDKLHSPWQSPCRYWWPLSNLWLSVSISTQKEAYEKIPTLLEIPAAVRGLSIEPLLEALKLELRELQWLICGCESGAKRRPCNLEWINSITQQCQAADVPVYVKQLSINGKVSRNMSEWPEELRIQEYPAC